MIDWTFGIDPGLHENDGRPYPKDAVWDRSNPVALRLCALASSARDAKPACTEIPQPTWSSTWMPSGTMPTEIQPTGMSVSRPMAGFVLVVKVALDGIEDAGPDFVFGLRELGWLVSSPHLPRTRSAMRRTYEIGGSAFQISMSEVGAMVEACGVSGRSDGSSKDSAKRWSCLLGTTLSP